MSSSSRCLGEGFGTSSVGKQSLSATVIYSFKQLEIICFFKVTLDYNWFLACCGRQSVIKVSPKLNVINKGALVFRVLCWHEHRLVSNQFFFCWLDPIQIIRNVVNPIINSSCVSSIHHDVSLLSRAHRLGKYIYIRMSGFCCSTMHLWDWSYRLLREYNTEQQHFQFQTLIIQFRIEAQEVRQEFQQF